MPSSQFRNNEATIKLLRSNIKKIPTTFRLAVIDVALELHGGIIERSPVDTGWYRINNRLAFNSKPDESTVGSPDGKNSESSAVAAAAQIARAAGVAAGEITEVILFNNVPYAAKIERGSSKQAPLGVYAVTLEDVERRLRLALEREGLL